MPSSLVQGPDGTLYGAAEMGGPAGTDSGDIYEISPSGADFTVIYPFSGPDGAGPDSLLLTSDGTLYGATQWGGPAFTSLQSGDGLIFKMNTSGGDYAALYEFTRTGLDGYSPEALIEGPGHLLYGQLRSL